MDTTIHIICKSQPMVITLATILLLVHNRDPIETENLTAIFEQLKYYKALTLSSFMQWLPNEATML